MTAACIATTGSGGELQMGNRCVVVPVHDCHQVLSSVQSSGCYELSKITVSISSQLRCEKLFPVNSVAAAVMMARIGRLPLVCAYMILAVACTSVHAIPLGMFTNFIPIFHASPSPSKSSDQLMVQQRSIGDTTVVNCTAQCRVLTVLVQSIFCLVQVLGLPTVLDVSLLRDSLELSANFFQFPKKCL